MAANDNQNLLDGKKNGSISIVGGRGEYALTGVSDDVILGVVELDLVES